MISILFVLSVIAYFEGYDVIGALLMNSVIWGISIVYGVSFIVPIGFSLWTYIAIKNHPSHA